MKSRKDLRLLLMQIREEEEILKQELECFARFSELQISQVDSLDVFKTPKFSPDLALNYDGLLIGGSSSASILEPEKYPFVESCLEMIKRCVDESLPTFASCFGFQIATVALGGKVTRSPGEDFEMGTLPVSLNDDAQADPLYRDTPNPFLAISVHKEKATKVPPSCQLLAYTNDCVHSFRVKDKPFWTFQFHPEADKAVLIHRLKFYMDQYTHDDKYQQVIDQAVETPESNLLMKKFVDRVLL